MGGRTPRGFFCPATPGTPRARGQCRSRPSPRRCFLPRPEAASGAPSTLQFHLPRRPKSLSLFDLRRPRPPPSPCAKPPKRKSLCPNRLRAQPGQFAHSTPFSHTGHATSGNRRDTQVSKASESHTPVYLGHPVSY